MSNTLVEQKPMCTSRIMIPNNKVPHNMLVKLTRPKHKDITFFSEVRNWKQKNPITKQQLFSTTKVSGMNMNKLDQAPCRKVKLLESCVHVSMSNVLML